MTPLEDLRRALRAVEDGAHPFVLVDPVRALLAEHPAQRFEWQATPEEVANTRVGRPGYSISEITLRDLAARESA